jgi:malonyl-ACP O-methyltransferase BioC
MPQNIDKKRVQTSFSKSLYSYNQHAVVQTSMANKLIEGLKSLKQFRYDAVLEIGCGSGVLTERFMKNFQTGHFYVNDLVPEYQQVVAVICKQYPGSSFSYIGGDIEGIQNLPEQLDLLISNATFQWLEDFKGMLAKIHRILKPGGLLAFSTFGPWNLEEIRALSGNSLHYLGYEELRMFLSEYFEIISCSEELVTLKFPSPRYVLKHLCFTGVNGISGRQWTKTTLREFEQEYWQRFGNDRQVPLTYHPILCVVKKKSPFL